MVGVVLSFLSAVTAVSLASPPSVGELCRRLRTPEMQQALAQKGRLRTALYSLVQHSRTSRRDPIDFLEENYLKIEGSQDMPPGSMAEALAGLELRLRAAQERAVTPRELFREIESELEDAVPYIQRENAQVTPRELIVFLAVSKKPETVHPGELTRKDQRETPGEGLKVRGLYTPRALLSAPQELAGIRLLEPAASVVLNFMGGNGNRNEARVLFKSAIPRAPTRGSSAQVELVSQELLELHVRKTRQYEEKQIFEILGATINGRDVSIGLRERELQLDRDSLMLGDELHPLDYRTEMQ